ncbi:NAD(P)-dependent oxidoreductase [Flaviaesturariibacter amylovorans]|uniref:2-hydroxyacid dehydrogenase n=1 Tax=Flaviaesturariibacter amylovorans TaxID=1084520 RepID=A0ABP8H5E1_9BACT
MTPSDKRMRVLFYSSRKHELPVLQRGCPIEIEAIFCEDRLTEATAHLAGGYDAICLFTSDDASAGVVEKLAAEGVRYIALRSAGYDHVDLAAAASAGIRVCRVPAYSPAAVAEHALLLALALLRRLPLAHQQVHLQNFSLHHLVGRELGSLTVGVIGTGAIGGTFARLLTGFGCTVLAFDVAPDRKLEADTGLQYADLNTVLRYADLIALHVPLNRDTQHLVNSASLARMKRGVVLINTARGGLVDTEALLEALSSG